MGRQSKVANEVPQIFILQTAVKIAGLVLSRFEIVEDENIAPSLKQTRHERRLNTRPPVFLQIDAISREKPDCSLKEQIRTGVLLKAPPEHAVRGRLHVVDPACREYAFPRSAEAHQRDHANIAARPCLAKASGKSRAIH